MPNNDLISREAAIKAVHKEFDRYLVLDKNGLRLTQSIDAEPIRHGKWIKMTGMMPPEFHGHYECSECGWHLAGIRDTKNHEENFSYCPNCGAKMDKGELE